MTRVRVIVEGQTEESFIKNVLAPFLASKDVYLTPLVLGVPGHKGGNVNYARVKKDILIQMKQDRSACCSMMLDLYGLGAGFPGTPAPRFSTGMDKAKHIEAAILQDIVQEAPELRPEIRFLPYLQVHEYEGLLFSDAEGFATALGRTELGKKLVSIRKEFKTPEDINDSPNTAPSKRILQLCPSYKKKIEGTTAAQVIGIDLMLRECDHFRQWVERLLTISPV